MCGRKPFPRTTVYSMHDTHCKWRSRNEDGPRRTYRNILHTYNQNKGLCSLVPAGGNFRIKRSSFHPDACSSWVKMRHVWLGFSLGYAGTPIVLHICKSSITMSSTPSISLHLDCSLIDTQDRQKNGGSWSHSYGQWMKTPCRILFCNGFLFTNKYVIWFYKFICLKN